MIEEKIYVVEDGVELIIIEKINYGGINYMLLKNNKTPEIRIAYEYDSKLFYITQEDADYQIVSALLLDKLKETLEKFQ